MKRKKTLVHAQILLSKYPETGQLGLEMEQLVAHWRAGLVEGEIKEPMHTLFLEEGSFVRMVTFLKECADKADAQ
jgi:hypothetical protein